MQFKIVFLFLAFQVNSIKMLRSQPLIPEKETPINNLVHLKGYTPAPYNAIPTYKKTGSGKQVMILIPGMGFDGSIFNDFVTVNQSRYTFYIITIPGYGKTKAPPMPDTSTSYGAQSWNKSAEEGIVKLIQKKKLHKPIVCGHFVQGVQLAARLAIDHPDLIGGVIFLGGPAKFIALMNQKIIDNPVDRMILSTDRYTAPVWFKKMAKETFDANNFAPEIYSIDSAKGDILWKQVAKVNLPVAVRYACEYFASDVRAEFHKIKCPVLVLRARYTEDILNDPANSYLKPQFIDSWDSAYSYNKLITVKDINNAAACVWKDQPVQVYSLIDEFCEKITE